MTELYRDYAASYRTDGAGGFIPTVQMRGTQPEDIRHPDGEPIKFRTSEGAELAAYKILISRINKLFEAKEHVVARTTRIHYPGQANAAPAGGADRGVRKEKRESEKDRVFRSFK
jgi:hypothetical protein